MDSPGIGRKTSKVESQDSFTDSTGRKISNISDRSKSGPISKLERYLDGSNRKISTISDRVKSGHVGHPERHYDATLAPPSRKISSLSDHAGMGPVRKKSILHNNTQQQHQHAESNIFDTSKPGNGAELFIRNKKISVPESVQSRARFSDIDDTEDDKSWCYMFCMKCRQSEKSPSWSPPMWDRVCPYPFCPTYRQFSRIVGIVLIGMLIWGVLYSIFGSTVIPGGKFFQLLLLSICSYLGGWLVSLTTLPALVGMMFTGVLLQNLDIVNIDESFSEITEHLRSGALVIILIRAGLDLDPQAMKRLKWTMLRLGLVPWAVEAGVAAILGRYVLGIPWEYGILMGFALAAVAPAVVVPCLFRLRSKNYGVAKGIPTLIVAVAGIDDATSVALFGIMKSIMFSNDSLTFQILQGPISIFGGIGFGILWGCICNYIPEKRDPFVVPLRILMLLMGGMISMFGSEMLGFGGAGALGCVSAAFVCLCFWTRQGWEIEENPASTAFEIFWMIVEPVLFGISGAEIKIHELNGHYVSIGVGVIITTQTLRILSTVAVGIGSSLNIKEKVFAALAWMPKAIVQAALGPVALSMVKTEPERGYAERILMICMLSIMLTAPLGALLITVTGPRLLTKTKFPVEPEVWRRSHRPSISVISIAEEAEKEEEEADTEKAGIGEKGSEKKF